MFIPDSESEFLHLRSRIWIFPSQIPDLDFSFLDLDLFNFHPRFRFRNTELTKNLIIFNLAIVTVLRIRDVYPGSRIQKQQQKTGVKIFFLSNHFL